MTTKRQTLTLTVTRAEGALERVLGLIRRRSHRIDSVAAVPGNESWSVVISIETERTVEPLVKQLRNLVDVTAVSAA